MFNLLALMTGLVLSTSTDQGVKTVGFGVLSASVLSIVKDIAASDAGNGIH